jgi:hypothetical protein
MEINWLFRGIVGKMQSEPEIFPLEIMREWEKGI